MHIYTYINMGKALRHADPQWEKTEQVRFYTCIFENRRCSTMCHSVLSAHFFDHIKNERKKLCTHCKQNNGRGHKTLDKAKIVSQKKNVVFILLQSNMGKTITV